jgi:hypothetical protein
LAAVEAAMEELEKKMFEVWYEEMRRREKEREGERRREKERRGEERRGEERRGEERRGEERRGEERRGGYKGLTLFRGSRAEGGNRVYRASRPRRRGPNYGTYFFFTQNF